MKNRPKDNKRLDMKEKIKDHYSHPSGSLPGSAQELTRFKIIFYENCKVFSLCFHQNR